MTRARHLLCGAAFFAAARFTAAHDLPLSYIDLHINGAEIDVIVQASAKNFVRELPGVSEEDLLDTGNLRASGEKLATLINSHFAITTDGTLLPIEATAAEALAARRDLKLRFHGNLGRAPENVRVRCDLFSFDPRHRTFLNVYDGNKLRFQGILDESTSKLDCAFRTQQPIITVVRQFLWEGVHHIFISPDHILFVVGLLLLGGTVWQLLRIVTAFTIAHTVTLVLATLNILNPPARIIEPLIALSIVFVGVHALLRLKQDRDWRLLFAFCFGFVHGFGFANVLREMAPSTGCARLVPVLLQRRCRARPGVYRSGRFASPRTALSARCDTGRERRYGRFFRRCGRWKLLVPAARFSLSRSHRDIHRKANARVLVHQRREN